MKKASPGSISFQLSISSLPSINNRHWPIPNISIISPSDSLETVKAVEQALKYHQSCYIRITGGSNNPIINQTDYKSGEIKSYLEDLKVSKVYKAIQNILG